MPSKLSPRYRRSGKPCSSRLLSRCPQVEAGFQLNRSGNPCSAQDSLAATVDAALPLAGFKIAR